MGLVHLAIKMKILWLYIVFKKTSLKYQNKMYKSVFSTRLTVGRIQEKLSGTKATSPHWISKRLETSCGESGSAVLPSDQQRAVTPQEEMGTLA